MNVAPTLGLLGRAPGLAPGALLRVGRLADLERHLGSLAERPSLVAHAAAHAFMGGVDRILIGAPRDEAPRAWAEALTALCGAGASAVLAPGDLNPAIARALVDAISAWTSSARSAPALWLDSPAVAAADIITYRAELAPALAPIWLVTPAVRALTPGRPRPERIGGCTVVGALVMGSAHELGALVEVERRYAPDDLERLRADGRVAALVARGPRRLVGLAWPPPPIAVHDQAIVGANAAGAGEDDVAPPRDDLEARILRAVQDATEPIIADRAGGPHGASLWPALERAARVVLDGFVASGAITEFALRAADGEVEVGYRTAKRVREVKVSVARLDPEP